MKSRNSWIELNRFIFAVSVFIFHLCIYFNLEPAVFRGGFLSVEFFFFVAGYFLSKNFKKDPGIKFAFYYIKDKIKKVYPMYVISLVIAVAADCIDKRTFRLINIPEFFMVQWLPFEGEVLNSPLWFMPALIFGGLFLILLASLFKTKADVFGLFICPLLSVSIYVYFFVKEKKIDIIGSYYGIVRGVAGVALGWFIYSLLAQIKERKEDSLICLIISETMIFFLLVWENFAHRDRYNFIFIVFLAVAFIFLIHGNVKVKDKTAKVFSVLGKISLPLYIFHVSFFRLIKALFLLFFERF